MSIGRKLTLALILGISVIQAGNAYLRINQEIGRLRSDQVQDQTKQGRILGAAVERVWETDGDIFARRVVEEMRVSGEEPQLAWVWLDELAAHGQLSAEGLRTLRTGEQISLVDVTSSGEHRRYSYVPISIADSRPAALVLSEPLSPRHPTFACASSRRC